MVDTRTVLLRGWTSGWATGSLLLLASMVGGCSGVAGGPAPTPLPPQAQHSPATTDDSPSAPQFPSHLESAPPRLDDSLDRFAGEFGLWVSEVGDSLFVHWLTERAEAGSLRVVADGRVLDERRTSPGTAHRAAVPMPRATDFDLEYGALDAVPADRYRTTIRSDAGRGRAREAISGVDSIFVMSDVHGEFDRVSAVLKNAGLVDDGLRWSGGRSNLVIAGDIFDRGPGVIPLLWMLYRLEGEARLAGGDVHVMLGNHEIMVMLNDLRYVNARELAVAEMHGVPYWRLFDSRYSILGGWLASKPAVLRVDRVLIAHGGVASDYLPYTVESYADTLSAFIRHDLFRLWNDEGATIQIEDERYERWLDFFWGERSVFWYRGYVESDDLGGDLRAVLERMRADVHVVGHTPIPVIASRYGGTLIAVNPYEFGAEMLLLVRDGGEYRRFRYGLEGPPEPL